MLKEKAIKKRSEKIKKTTKNKFKLPCQTWTSQRSSHLGVWPKTKKNHCNTHDTTNGSLKKKLVMF